MTPCQCMYCKEYRKATKVNVVYSPNCLRKLPLSGTEKELTAKGKMKDRRK